MVMGDADIERMVEAQARGEQATLADVPVERRIPQSGSLDTRRSKSGLAAAGLLGTGEARGSVDGQPGEGTPPPADPAWPPGDEGVTTEADSGLIERQDLSLARHLPVPVEEEDLGLVFRRDSM